MKLKNNKGVTLIALVVTVIILLLITGAIIYNTKNQITVKKIDNLYIDLDTIKTKVNEYYLNYGELPVLCDYLDKIQLIDLMNENASVRGATLSYDSAVNPDDGDEYYVIDLEKLDGLTLNYGYDEEYKTVKANGDITLTAVEDEVYVVNGVTHQIYFPHGIFVDGVMYYTYEFSDADIEITIEEGWKPATENNQNNDWYAYKDASGNIAEVNKPKLADGMTPIKYVAGTDTDSNTFATITNGSHWANAMTKDGSMWVWIPRFAYQITSGYHKNGEDLNPENPNLGAGTIEIAFLDGTSNKFLDSSITGTVVSGSDVTETTYSDNTKWILAPGFTLGDEQLTGFWFAKFEASNTAETTGNDTTLTLQIKPNKTSWRSITPANIFTVCQNLTNATNYSTYFNNVSNVDTHMTKNVEWGAVAYLAHSKYGLNGQEICINTNSSYLTGMGSGSTTSTSSTTNEYNTTTGITASTTKNVYGIYDMSGGAYEYVAACLSGYTNKLTSKTDTDYINKYIDVYSNYNQTKYGDAVYETSSSSSNANSWFNDYSNFVVSIGPVFRRGGSYSGGSSAGLFYFSYYLGNASGSHSFRPVCVVK